MKNFSVGVFLVCACLCVALLLTGCATDGERIDKERAIELAIEHFGLDEADCTVRKAELDEGKYEIEFLCGDKEYEVEIDAVSKKVRERDVEHNDDYVGTSFGDATRVPDTTQTPDTLGAAEKITAERAKELAITHFGLKAEDCSFVKAELDGIKYEIELICDKKEYEAEVHAYTGEILEASVESVFD